MWLPSRYSHSRWQSFGRGHFPQRSRCRKLSRPLQDPSRPNGRGHREQRVDKAKSSTQQTRCHTAFGACLTSSSAACQGAAAAACRDECHGTQDPSRGRRRAAPAQPPSSLGPAEQGGGREVAAEHRTACTERVLPSHHADDKVSGHGNHATSSMCCVSLGNMEWATLQR